MRSFISRRTVSALGGVAVSLAFLVTSASAAKPPSASLSANLAVTSTAATCTGTLTVTWNAGSGKGVTGLSWSADPSDTGTLSFAFGGISFSKAQKSGSQTVGFTLTAGTGKVDVTATGAGLITQSNTVTCNPPRPDLTITGISFTFPAGDPPWSYTATVKNIGSGTATVANVLVQGYYTASTDTTTFPPLGGVPLLPGDDPACGTIMQPFATTLAPGSSVDVVVGCGAGPALSADNQLMVGVNLDDPNAIPESSSINNVAVVPLPPAWTLSPSSIDFGSVAVGSFNYSYDASVQTGQAPVVIQGPTTLTGDSAFWDVQGGSCWQQYEALGNPIPAHTSCTIEVGFHPLAAGSYSGTLIVTRCLGWFINPIQGSLNCDNATLDGTQSVVLSGSAS